MTWLDPVTPCTDGDTRLEQGLRGLGREHEPSPGWEREVFESIRDEEPRPPAARWPWVVATILVLVALVSVVVLGARGAL